MISPLPGVSDAKPGSAMRALPGISAKVVDDDGRPMWVIEKPETRRKIDAAMAGCLAWEARRDAQQAGAKKKQRVVPKRIR